MSGLKLHKKLSKLTVEETGRELLGQILVRELDGHRLAGRIVETEAYHQSDPSAHTFGGPSQRNAAMFGPAGHAYIYFSYGVHWCFNVTAGKVGEGAGILIRALEPLEGLEIMKQNRNQTDIYKLCSGPGKLTQALQIDKTLYGHDLSQPPLYIEESMPVAKEQVVATTRVGISKAMEAPLRFYIKDSPFVSKL